ncbi:alpha/beta hydrolase fold domain-containing protein [Streptosporangium canum]|uniref:alpha/beta hydrolase fold domain-containing protein n=1 Tax=Streptosporangium canum TaxID=324952 RepID=UPI001FEB3CC1|nr:alpha/beta hydrolase fold domain-containing protein [Streptosporangium canum]
MVINPSAGATLVLSALLVLKQAGDALPAAALAISPQTDLTLSSPSIDANDGQDVVNRAVLDHVRTQYLAGAQPDAAPQSPLHGDLRGRRHPLGSGVATTFRTQAVGDRRTAPTGIRSGPCGVQLNFSVHGRSSSPVTRRRVQARHGAPGRT